jgi:hypothetical protein
VGRVQTPLAKERGIGTTPTASESFPVPRLIELRPMDRENARQQLSAGLVTGGIAAGVFALCFVAAFLYIAQ